MLVVSDGAPGLVSAVEQTFPGSLRQRCTIHRARNVLAKVPVSAQAEVKAAYWQIFDDIAAHPAKPPLTKPSDAPTRSWPAMSTSTRPRSPA